MSLLIRDVDGEPVIEGTAEQVERFSTALLAGAVHTDWLSVVDDRIVMTDGTREVVYRVNAGWGVLPVDWRDLPFNDDTFVTAELVSDTTPEPQP